jgi:hypothetical protein
MQTTRTGSRPPSEPGSRLLTTLHRERSRRLATIARHDRHIAEAAGDFALQALWRNIRRRAVEDAQRLKNWLDEEGVDHNR